LPPVVDRGVPRECPACAMLLLGSREENAHRESRHERRDLSLERLFVRLARLRWDPCGNAGQCRPAATLPSVAGS
jgi:hypothetical protein